MRHAAIFAGAILLLVSATPKISAWDEEGHEIVARAAYAQLNPKAKQAVDELAHEMTGPTGQPYDPITLSIWMDEIRKNPAMPDHGRFLSWHYIDIPIDSRDPMPSFEPGTDTEAHGDVVQALKRAMVVLKGGSDPYIKSKAMALAIVMHLVGDIHQPLHCATKYFFTHGELHDDKGGNKEDVLNGPPMNKKFNLHAFWDSAYRAEFDPADGDVVLEAGSSEEKKDPIASDKLAANFDQWARDSNAIARDFVYREITTTENKKYCRLSSGYVEKAHEIAQQQLHLAGERLAALLNETLGVP